VKSAKAVGADRHTAALDTLSRGRSTAALCGINATLFGPQPMTEHQNPDGVTVRAPVLQGTVGLYVEIGGSRIEATTACVGFIGQMRSLLQAAAAAVVAEGN